MIVWPGLIYSSQDCLAAQARSLCLSGALSCGVTASCCRQTLLLTH